MATNRTRAIVSSVDVDLDQKMRESYVDYAMSVIIARALPDVRDGLKPVPAPRAVRHV